MKMQTFLMGLQKGTTAQDDKGEHWTKHNIFLLWYFSVLHTHEYSLMLTQQKWKVCAHTKICM